MTDLELTILRAAYNGGRYLAVRRHCTPRPRFRRAKIKSWLQIGELRIDGEGDALAECLGKLEEKGLLLDIGESRWVLSEEAKSQFAEQE